MKNEQIPSQIIKNFLDFVESAKCDYDYNLEAMKTEEQITQDLLHQLELVELNYRERSKIATQLAKNRQNGRNYKDMVEQLEPIVTFFSSTHNRNFLNHLTQLLGQIRKVESYHKNRLYIPKVLPYEPIVEEIKIPEVATNSVRKDVIK